MKMLCLFFLPLTSRFTRPKTGSLFCRSGLTVWFPKLRYIPECIPSLVESLCYFMADHGHLANLALSCHRSLFPSKKVCNPRWGVDSQHGGGHADRSVCCTGTFVCLVSYGRVSLWLIQTALFDGRTFIHSRSFPPMSSLKMGPPKVAHSLSYLIWILFLGPLISKLSDLEQHVRNQSRLRLTPGECLAAKGFDFQLEMPPSTPPPPHEKCWASRLHQRSILLPKLYFVFSKIVEADTSYILYISSKDRCKKSNWRNDMRTTKNLEFLST